MPELLRTPIWQYGFLLSSVLLNCASGLAAESLAVEHKPPALEQARGAAKRATQELLKLPIPEINLRGRTLGDALDQFRILSGANLENCVRGAKRFALAREDPTIRFWCSRGRGDEHGLPLRSGDAHPLRIESPQCQLPQGQRH